MSYQKPTINKVDFAMMSKYGSPLKSQKIRSEIAGVDVRELVQNYGSPLFVFSQQEIEEKYHRLHEAFSSRYPDVVFGWSYKTNYLNAICNLYHKLGSIAEVVSEFEYQKARALGIEGKDIIFNGPYKPKEALKVAVEEGAKIHIDHLFEINDLEEIARELGVKIPVAIRVNMDTGIYPQWSRFGFNYESGEAIDAIERIHSGGLLELTGLHSHIGTFMLDASAYGKETAKLMDLKHQAEERFGYRIEYIDIGGGFASKNRLKGVYQSPDVIVPTPDDYAQQITEAIYTHNKSDTLPRLYLETGRHLIDEAGYLLTTVQAYKRFPDGMKGYILDAGVNLLYTATWYNFNFELDRRYEGLNEPSMLNGPLCMNIDILSENIMLPPLDRGTVITIGPVGAYNYTQSMQFIRYRPAAVLIDKERNVHLIKEPDDLETINYKERIPDYLKRS
ncbi:alanine racemase [Nitratifractor salsuginis]|uniref:Orn/DAP/Arg decarboxylase 2 n=1 Tax=Nitratifractor salsuginis (strain DSM 16511 / JCM 12458 / E9I37-1) TaxID=749222 RepID=E6X062_NITSE|nr:alanine racemase [Nitratifractor salsuginis]ADV46785.1 Orn/DAP/Arg decarboxylase 2 [Nitratifractor salsuginis DSM 16511]